MQEKIRTEGGKLFIEDEKLQRGANVRKQGSEIGAGELALPEGSHLSPAAIGFLAGIGTTHVLVYPPPSISIIVTGNELQQPGNQLEYGQVYESNSLTLTAALKLLQIGHVQIQHVADDPEALTAVLQQALGRSDIALLTGGISVGDYDFVLQATTRCNVASLFHQVRQRPGKPLYFGKWDEKLVFGLPGNPASVLTCFYMYVIPAIERLCQRKPLIHTIQVPMKEPYQKAPGLTHFLKGYSDGKTAAILDAQESYRLRSFARANCLIEIDDVATDCRQGTIVNVHLLPM
jgi:molybdopterin molybdotransferase